MILYLEFEGKGRRGGEQYHQHLHAYLKKRFPTMQPVALATLPDSVRTPAEQISHCLQLARSVKPRLVVSDISSAARNFPAVRHILRSGGQLLLVVQAKPDPAAGKAWWRRWLTVRFEHYLFRNAAVAVTNSAFTAGLTRQRAHAAVPTFIASPFFQFTPSDVPRTPGYRSGPMNLLYVGEISRVKGLLTLVEALGQLPQLDLHLHAVGGHSQEPDYYNEVTAGIERLQLGQRVTLHGYADRERLNEFYRQADVLVVPSRSEGYGMVIAEGFCFGLPVVASEAGAISGMVTDRVNGLLFSPGDHWALAQAVQTMCEDSSLRQRIRAANLEKAKSLSTWVDFEKTLDQQLLPQIETRLGKAHSG